MREKSFSVSAWLKEGFILQLDSGVFVLGEGPFQTSLKPARGFYYRNFFSHKEAVCWFLPSNVQYLSRKEVESLLDYKVKSPSLGTLQAELPNFSEFQEIFHQAQNQINQKKFSKVVVAFFEKIQHELKLRCYLKKLFRNTKKHASQGFIYGYWKNQQGILGFTPETLFSVRGSQFKTMALGGTSSKANSDLFLDNKEVQEQQFIFQDIEKTLSSLVKWKSKKSYEKEFFNLKHICTEMEGEVMSIFNFSIFCDKLHPTSALGGYPKEEALSWLAKQASQRERKVFGAPFGFFNGRDQYFCIVGIRGIQWDKYQVYVGSGCGLVLESILEKEWRELYLKREQIKDFFR